MMRPLACLLALALAFPAAAQIYTWRDKDGRINYSDVPPPQGAVSVVRGGAGAAPAAQPAPTAEQPAGGEAEAEAGAPAAPAPAANKPKSLAERELEFRQRRAQAAEAEAKAQKERLAAQERARECERAKSQLAALSSGQRMARFTSTGEREVLDDAARAQEIAHTRSVMESVCK